MGGAAAMHPKLPRSFATERACHLQADRFEGPLMVDNPVWEICGRVAEVQAPHYSATNDAGHCRARRVICSPRLFPQHPQRESTFAPNKAVSWVSDEAVWSAHQALIAARALLRDIRLNATCRLSNFPRFCLRVARGSFEKVREKSSPPLESMGLGYLAPPFGNPWAFVEKAVRLGCASRTSLYLVLSDNIRLHEALKI